MIITIDEKDLQARRRWGVTSDGTVISAAAVVGLADEADLYPTVVNSLGVVLRIHYQALRLFIKRAPFYPKPAPPSHKVSR